MRSFSSFFVIIAAILHSPSISRGDQAEIERFLREYPEASRRIESHLSRVKGTCRLKLQRGPNRFDIDKAIFAVDHGFRKVTIERDRNQGKARARVEIVYCIGDETAFSLVRQAGSERYVVQGIGSDHEDRMAYNSLFGRYLTAPYAILGTPLPKIMASPVFRLISAEEVEVDGERLFRIHYEVGEAQKADKVRLDLDPNSGWVIRSGEVRSGRFPGAEVAFDVQYESARDHPPYPRLVTFNDPNLLTSSCEFQSIVPEPTPEREFTMGYYGLADLTRPRIGERGGTSMIYWLIGIAALGFVAAYVLRRLASRPGPGLR